MKFEKEKDEFYNEAFKNCRASAAAKRISIRLCQSYGISGICDPAYIANVIDAELKENP